MFLDRKILASVREGRSTHDALKCAKIYVQAGYPYILDIELKKIFDQVNHD